MGEVAGLHRPDRMVHSGPVHEHQKLQVVLVKIFNQCAMKALAQETVW